jgi:DNA-binding response OmpR family regulator
MSIRQTILIIENDQPTLQMYCHALEQVYDVLASSIEDDILALVKTHPIRAIVLEPGPAAGRGWDLLADLSHAPKLLSVPIIICTTQDERRRAQEIGSTTYLIKPISPATLLSTVRRLISHKSYQEAQHE